MKKTILCCLIVAGLTYAYQKKQAGISEQSSQGSVKQEKVSKLQWWAKKNKAKKTAYFNESAKEYWVEELCDGNHADGPLAKKPHVENVKITITDEINHSGHISFDYYLGESVSPVLMEGDIVYQRFVISKNVEGNNGVGLLTIQGWVADSGQYFIYSFSPQLAIIESEDDRYAGASSKGQEERLRVFKKKEEYTAILESSQLPYEPNHSDGLYDLYPEEPYAEDSSVGQFSGSRSPAIEEYPEDMTFVDAQEPLDNQGHNFNPEEVYFN